MQKPNEKLKRQSGSFCVCGDSNAFLNSGLTGSESSSSRIGFVLEFTALYAAPLPKNLRAVGDESGATPACEGMPRVAGCSAMRLTHEDGDLKPDGTDSSEHNAKLAEKKKKENSSSKTLLCKSSV